LVVDADSADCLRLVEYCRASGATVLTEADGAQALIAFGRHSPDLVLLSDRLTVVSWQRVAAAIRASSDIPIILGVDSQPSPISWKSLGVSAAWAHPYQPVEAPQVLDRVLRNTVRRPAGNTGLRAGRLTMLEDAFEVRADGIPIPLTLREFELLRLFMKHADKVVAAEQIQTEIWGAFGADARPATIKVHVGRLRSKLGEAADLVTVRGMGYKLRTR
jgi:DNA-binding response OmpR family regulator